MSYIVKVDQLTHNFLLIIKEKVYHSKICK